MRPAKRGDYKKMGKGAHGCMGKGGPHAACGVPGASRAVPSNEAPLISRCGGGRREGRARPHKRTNPSNAANAGRAARHGWHEKGVGPHQRRRAAATRAGAAGGHAPPSSLHNNCVGRGAVLAADVRSPVCPSARPPARHPLTTPATGRYHHTGAGPAGASTTARQGRAKWGRKAHSRPPSPEAARGQPSGGRPMQ